MYNKGCIDNLSGSNGLDSASWRAYIGRMQFCVHTLKTNKLGPMSDPTTIVTATKTDLNWSRTTRFNETAFCTRIENEPDEFCVGESLIESISMQMAYMFDATAVIDPSDRSTIIYSSEFAAVLLKEVMGETWKGSPLCDMRRAAGGQNPNPFTYEGLQGFRLRLERMGGSLTHA